MPSVLYFCRCLSYKVLQVQCFSESLRLIWASSPKGRQLWITLLTGLMRKCFVQGRSGHAEIHAASRAADCLQSYPKCPVMIFPDSWLARLAHVTPQISPDNTLRHSGWSHSPDLAAPANSGEERRKTFPLICSICWKRGDSPALAPSVAPIDFEAFVSPRPWIASQGLLETCMQTLQVQLAIMNCRNVKSQRDVTDSSALFGTMLSHLCCFVALIAFVIEGWLNQAVAPPNEMLIRDSEIHSLLIWCYFSRKMRIIFSNATCKGNYSIIALSRCHRRAEAKNITTPQGHFVTLHLSFILLNAVLWLWHHLHRLNK